MSTRQQHINDLCPNGVEWKKIKEVAEVARGKRVVKSEASHETVFPLL